MKGNSGVFLARLTGAKECDGWNADRWTKWWEKASSRFAEGVCHRKGRPMDVGVLVKDLADELALPDTAEELRLITGVDFGYDPEGPDEQPDVAARARTWWKENRARFVPGRLYKHGFEQPCSTATSARPRRSRP